MTCYIQYKYRGLPLETVDEFDTRKEAHLMLNEYILADPYNHYYLSSRPCKAWKDKEDNSMLEVKVFQLGNPTVAFFLNKDKSHQEIINLHEDSYHQTATIIKAHERSLEKELESIFSIGNSEEAPELKIESDKYHSLSVGDIIAFNGKSYLCADVGWTEVNFAKD